MISCARSIAVLMLAAQAGMPEATSVMGKPLYPIELAAETRSALEANLAAAEAELAKNPASEEAIIWFGRRQAYLWRYRDAIATYSKGIALHPNSFKLYRHRGHRYITVRESSRAIADFARAASLVSGKPDIVEPDGQPNAQNTPIGTLHSNIDYHLALAHYLQGDFGRAIPIYQRELDHARNDDRLVSIAHWYYMALRRLGRDREAAEMLARLARPMNVIENQTYADLLRMYRGEIPPDSVLGTNAAGEMSVTDATAAYGIGNWHLYNGRKAEADRIFRRIVGGGQWGAFGYIAAEAELARATPR